MSVYQSEDEQVEAIKKWIRNNGISVISGILLGLALIFGWRTWENYRENHSQNASILFSNMENLNAAGRTDDADQMGKMLIADYGSTAYASFAGMQLAKDYYQRGDKGSAAEELRWVMGNAPSSELKELARLRLGYLLLDMGKPDQALKLAQEKGVLMPGTFAELRGDIARAKGNDAAARSAYQEADKLGVANQALLKMKLVALGPVAPVSPVGVKP